jgi:hypothetical protein
MNNSPLQFLCPDISSIIADNLSIFKRKKVWEDLGDKVKETVYNKSPHGNYIASEIILSNLDENHGKILLSKMDNIYMNDYAYGLYYVYTHFTSLFKSEYWVSPDDDNVCDYADGIMYNIKLKEGISCDMIPRYNESLDTFTTFNAKLLFTLPEKIGRDNALSSIVNDNNLEEGHKYLCNTGYINKIIKRKNNDEFKNKLSNKDKRLIIEELEKWKIIYISLKDIVQDKINNIIHYYDINEEYYDNVVSNCEEKINDINNLVKDIEDF